VQPATGGVVVAAIVSALGVAGLVLVAVVTVAAGTRSSESRGDALVAGDAAPAPAADAGGCEPGPLRQRAARVLVVGLPGVTTASDPIVAEVLDVGVGGVMITDRNVESAVQVRQLVSNLRARARRPLVVAADEESGRVTTFRQLLGPSPSARVLASTRAPAEVRDVAEELGSELAALGIDVALAPVVDLDAGPANGIIGNRSFSADPATAATYGLAWAEGLAAAGVHPTAKHFPGHGRSADDTHRQGATVDATLADLRATDVRPFARLVGAGVPLVMLDHVTYTALDRDLPASLAPDAYRLLRDLGFEGVAITDSIGMGAINLRWSFSEAAVLAVAAGADAVLSTDGSQARVMRDGLVDAVRSGRLDEERLDEAAGRMAALAGGDTDALVCRSVTVPDMTPAAG
jgi:beta-N-acetylhexosaminidase